MSKFQVDPMKGGLEIWILYKKLCRNTKWAIFHFSLFWMKVVIQDFSNPSD